MSSGIESPLLRRILLRLTELGFRVFRQNVGQGWIGKATMITEDRTWIELNRGDVYIYQARPLHAGLIAGSSDIIGWRTITATEGQRVAQFVAVEVKTATGRVSPAQQQFLDQVRAAGGHAVVARSEDDVT